MKGTALFCLLVLFACKSKSKSSERPGSAGSAVVAADAAPPKNTVTVPAGAAQFGCIGWNAATKSVACIGGESAAGDEPHPRIDYVNSAEPRTKLVIEDGKFDDTAAANATLAKLGMEALPSPATRITGPVPGDSDLGDGAKLVWADKIKDEGGDNQAPTVLHEVSVTCPNNQSVEILNVEEEGYIVEFNVWSVPGFRVIEEVTHIGREGESRDIRKAMLLELATCKLVRAAG